jgi:polyisoprenyl-phosphate glycosyltransferase
MKRDKISAIIACYKDNKAIPIMYKQLVEVFQKIDVDFEILFVNDGSPDDTEIVLHDLVLRDSRVIAINHSRNFSSQMAFTSGMHIATGDAVVLLDGDLQDPPAIIELFFKKWKEGYQVVYGVRTKREAPILMQFSYKAFYRLFHLLSYIQIPLDSGDFSLIDRKVVDVLKMLPERDRFIRGLRAWVGFRQVGVPYERPERMFGKTTNNVMHNMLWAIKGIFAFSYVPIHFYTFLSMAMFFLSMIGIFVQILSRIMNPNIPWGVSTTIVVILFLGSIQLLGISILGEYIGKIFEEVKQRPQYVVKNIDRQ